VDDLKRGFLFSVDTLFALFLAVIVLSGVFLFISRHAALDLSAQDLTDHSLAAIAALGENDTLRLSLSEDKSGFIQEFLDNATSRTVCLNLTIYGQDLSIKQTYQKQSCIAGQYITIARRPLYANNTPHMVAIRSWYS
jgi:hypothetical protein